MIRKGTECDECADADSNAGKSVQALRRLNSRVRKRGWRCLFNVDEMEGWVSLPHNAGMGTMRGSCLARNQKGKGGLRNERPV